MPPNAILEGRDRASPNTLETFKVKGTNSSVTESRNSQQ